jgi:transcriptional regulator with XRE-family HTH domain
MANFQPKRMLQARYFRGLTQRELGELIGMTRQSVGQIERGVRAPSIEDICKLCWNLKMPHGFFFWELGPIESGKRSVIFMCSHSEFRHD